MYIVNNMKSLHSNTIYYEEKWHVYEYYHGKGFYGIHEYN